MPSYTDCLFFAEKASARKGAALTGSVLVAARKLTPDIVNGSTVKALGTPRAEPGKPGVSVPVATWVSVDYLARRCVEISEADARKMAPRMFDAIDTFQRSPEFRTMHAIEVAEAIKRGAFTLQSADEAINGRLGTNVPVEASSGYGRAHKAPRA